MAATAEKNAPQSSAIQRQGEQQSVHNNAERFTAKVMQEFGSNIGALQVTDYQRQLIQGYFIAIDRALKTAEEERQRKNNNNSDHRYDNPLPVTWENVNLNDLALDVVHYARMGLDMMMDNHLFPIPYRNKKTQKYDVTLMPGYNGIQYIAEKYAVEAPVAVTVELVYSTDTFVPIKKSAKNRIETYEFSINNAFERGDPIGGFGYIEYTDPVKNKLVLMTMKDILKRKPQHASANFWGGKQKVWENGKQVEQESDGWFEEMCLKTIKREVYSAKHIPRDPKKIDDNYQYMKMREAKIAELEAQEIIDSNASGSVIDVTPAHQQERQPATVLPEPTPAFTVEQSTREVKEPVPPAAASGQTTFGGPDF